MDITVNAATVTLPRHKLSPDQVVFRHPSHTGDAPFLVTIKRREGANGVADRLEMVVSLGKLDPDGVPLSKKVVCDIAFNIPDGYDSADFASILDVAKGLVDSTIPTNFESTQAIPYE